jgi:hypothetical protein
MIHQTWINPRRHHWEYEDHRQWAMGQWVAFGESDSIAVDLAWQEYLRSLNLQDGANRLQESLGALVNSCTGLISRR